MKLSEKLCDLFYWQGEKISDERTVAITDSLLSEIEQLEADAELGRLVRRMPVDASLYHVSQDRWIVKDDVHDTPEAALKAALGEE